MKQIIGVLNMEKENVILIEAKSTGANFIHDVRELGHNPICMELHREYRDEEEKETWRRFYDLSYSLTGEELPEIIQADESYQKTLEMVRKYNPIGIVP